MPSLTIRHVTTYRYRQPVAFGEHRMMLRPRRLPRSKGDRGKPRDQPGADEPALRSGRIRQSCGDDLLAIIVAERDIGDVGETAQASMPSR
jgi:Bacterial transglutaminase-like N-terminal region